MKYKADAYEIREFDLDKIVYVEQGNGKHYTCVFGQLLDANGELTEFKYNPKLGVYEPCNDKVVRFSIQNDKGGV